MFVFQVTLSNGTQIEVPNLSIDNEIGEIVYFDENMKHQGSNHIVLVTNIKIISKD